jgi:AmmeMemoRadiSam system protein B
VEHAWVELFDGRHTLQEIHQRTAHRFGGRNTSMEQLSRFVARLEEGLLLHSPRFQRILDDPVRPPRCIGCYEGEAEALKQQLHQLFTHPRGAGLPGKRLADGSLSGILVPHIDYRRGGLCYTHGFKELCEKTDASLFVIIGTSHYSTHRYTLTRKNFQTPLGIMPTDQKFIDRLEKNYGQGLFDDEWLAHFPEHSIELEVVFLQYLFEGFRPIRIVPLVVGSFYDCVATQTSPTARPDIARMIQALRQTGEATQEPVCYIISGDLAHIGPKFNPEESLDEELLEHSRQQDQKLMRHAGAVNVAEFFRTIAAESDARNICGLPPAFTALSAIRPHSGKVLQYHRHVDPTGRESVSFASAAFYR